MKTETKIILTLFLTLGVMSKAEVGDLQIAFKVVDESGKPMSDVSVEASYMQSTSLVPVANNISEKQVNVTTDKDGQAQIKEAWVCNNYVYTGIKPVAGYYPDGTKEYRFQHVENGKWQPWNPTVNFVLRPILHPVAMYAKKTGNLTIPEIGKPVGYDLMVGDWVAPYGKGFKSDLVFTLERKPDKTVKTDDYYKRDVKLFDATLTVSFSNPDDGIQAIPVNEEYRGSQFSIPRYAPKDGYQSDLVDHTYRESAAKPIVEPDKTKLGYFYRVRTVKRDGKIVSARYGKMSNINFDVINSPTAIINFTYYLNPTPNDRNMEFDPKRNLFTNLKEFEQVSVP